MSFRWFILCLLGWLVDWLAGWLVGWLVGNTVLSETAQRIFLTFCMKLGDYKGRRVTAGFLKKILDLEIFAKRSPN